MSSASKKKKQLRVIEQRGSTELTIRAVVAEIVQRRPDDLAGDLHLQIDLGIDPGGRRALLSAMGEALDARFPDDFLDGVTTYADLTTAVRLSLSPC